MPHPILTVTLLAALCGPVWAINKCTGADGKVSFQDLPCTGKGELIKVSPGSGDARPQDATTTNLTIAKLQRDNEIAEAIRLRKPLVGMTMTQLNEAMGSPTKVNASNYNGVQSDQLIYERPDETWYVYPRSGIVNSVQHRPGAPLGSAGNNRSRPCPTALEIRNLETSASSISLSDVVRRGLMDQIRDAKACGRSG